MRLQGVIGGIHSRFKAVVVAQNALWRWQFGPVCGQQHHRLNQRIDSETLTSVFRVTEFKRIAELRNAMLNLNTGIHLHKEVTVGIDDALEGRDRIKTHSSTKTRRFLFHGIQRNNVSAEHCGFIFQTCSICFLCSLNERFACHGDFEQLLLVHLE